MGCPSRISGFRAFRPTVPAIEAIETVNIVTSNFEADQGMAGGAAVNVQVKSGTNSLRGSAFEYFEHANLRARNYFLPATSEKPKGTKNIYGGTIGGPIKREQAVLLRQSRDHRFEGGRRAVHRFVRAAAVAAAHRDTGREISPAPARLSTTRRPATRTARGELRLHSPTVPG